MPSPRNIIDDQTRLGPPSQCLVAGTEGTVAPQAMMMQNGRIMVKRSKESKAAIHLLQHCTTNKYANRLLWSTWKYLEDVKTNEDDEGETEAEKKTRLSVYPMSVFPCNDQDD